MGARTKSNLKDLRITRQSSENNKLQTNNHPVLELYKNNKILKLQDYIKLLDCMFVKDVLAGNYNLKQKTMEKHQSSIKRHYLGITCKMFFPYI